MRRRRRKAPIVSETRMSEPVVGSGMTVAFSIMVPFQTEFTPEAKVSVVALPSQLLSNLIG